MNTDENNQEGVVVPQDNQDDSGEETISVSRKEYDSLNQTLGSLKRELKDMKKATTVAKEETKEAPKASTADENNLLEKAFLRTANITSQDEVDLALSTAKKWGVSVDKLVDDEDFKLKLEKHRTQKSNELATSNLKGTASKGKASESSEYWASKGVPPTPNDIPDRATRVKIIRDMIGKGKSSKKFYND